MPRLAERLSTGAPDGSKPDRSQVPQQVNGRWGRSRMNVLVNIPTFKRLPMGAKTGANAVRYGPIQPDVLGLFVLVADS
jgi:hypothetical protein